MTVDQQFTALTEKLQLLLKQHARLQKENERLKEELTAARSQWNGSSARIQELEQQVSILKVSTGDLSEKDKKDFEKKVNQYLREVDKCIAFLSQ